MSGTLRRLARRLRGEGGFSVAETMTALMLMVIVGTTVGSTLASQMQATASLESESQTVDTLRVAITHLEREFRSAECVREPVPPSLGTTVSGPTLRFTTRSNGGSSEVTYTVENGALLRSEDGVQNEIADEMVDADQTFTYVETPRRSIDVRFVIEPANGNRRELMTTVTGRNAWRNC